MRPAAGHLWFLTTGLAAALAAGFGGAGPAESALADGAPGVASTSDGYIIVETNYRCVVVVWGGTLIIAFV